VQAGFWMRNTLIPLSIAFIDKDGVIVHIEDMEPQTEDLHLSPSLYRYAIEVNQGWYADNGFAVAGVDHLGGDLSPEWLTGNGKVDLTVVSTVGHQRDRAELPFHEGAQPG